MFKSQGAGLTEVPVLPQKVAVVDLRHNLIDEFPYNWPPLVTSIDLTSNRITTWPTRPFSSLRSSLKVLNLTENGLESTHPAMFQLTGLTSLYLKGNRLIEISPLVEHLSRLSLLDASNNRISDIPPQLCQLPNLRSLELVGNPLNNELKQLCRDSLPAVLARCAALYKSQSLQCAGLTSLGPLLLSTTSLTDLSLAVNSLTADSIAPLSLLTNLTSLSLRDNAIDPLPLALALIPTLQILDVSHNKISAAHPSLFALPHIRRIVLSFNSLPALDLPPFPTTSLKALLVDRNHIRDVRNLSSLSSLQVLDASFNGVCFFPPLFVCWPLLEELRLDDNALRSLPPDFTSLPALRVLSCANNALCEISPQISSCCDLETLVLRSNLLSVVPSDLWRASRLTQLDVTFNKVNNLPDDAIDNALRAREHLQSVASPTASAKAFGFFLGRRVEVDCIRVEGGEVVCDVRDVDTAEILKGVEHFLIQDVFDTGLELE